jgi:hypothetical protein
VDDDEIPVVSLSGAREVSAEVTVHVVIAVGDGALVLHAEVRGLDQLVAVVIPRVGSKPSLEAAQHRFDLRELRWAVQ